MNLLIAVVDPMGLSQFTTHVFASINAMWPVALGGLVLILFAYGVMRAGR